MKTTPLIILILWLMKAAPAQVSTPQFTLPAQKAETIVAYLMATDSNLRRAELQLELTHYKKSVASHHYTFALCRQKIPLLDALIKVNTDLNGRLLSVKKEYGDISKLFSFDLRDEKALWEKTDIESLFKGRLAIRDAKLKLDIRREHPEIVAMINCYDKTYDFTYVLNRHGETITEWNNSRYLKQDTLIHGKIFKPDPLTVILQTYGGIYIDDTDKNLAWFAPAYQNADILATYETSNSTFYLENNLVVIDDFDPPNLAPATSLTTDFYFNRSESGFEDVNVLYHITAFHDYIASLGYDTLLDHGITVDTHGMLGADNSVFNRNGGSPTLDFGTGGVDDAEDADVIIHEYSHGLSWSANGNDNFSNPRMGLDEGLADYFATSYSRSINPFNWEKMFSWDGHNEFWGGRVANTGNNYPAGANIYAVGEVWNAAMSGIWTDLGQIVTDKLMLEAMHFFTNNTTLSEAAFYVMQSDTLLFNGIHSNTICSRFQSKNILTGSCLPSAISEPTKANNITVSNTYGFAVLGESLKVGFDQVSSGTMSLYEISGKLLCRKTFSNSLEAYLSPATINPGIYLLRIATANDSRVVMLSR